jgi:hypothetical protein
LGLTASTLEEADAALFLVSAEHGIVTADLESWRTARELYIPSVVIICDLAQSEIDFDDMALIAGKMLDPIVTPFLVLHDDHGAPVALIDLLKLVVIDYTDGEGRINDPDPEHIELVQEFREEFLQQLEDSGEASFEAGLLFPALPWVEGTQIGIDQIKNYLNQIPIIR